VTCTDLHQPLVDGPPVNNGPCHFGKSFSLVSVNCIEAASSGGTGVVGVLCEGHCPLNPITVDMCVYTWHCGVCVYVCGVCECVFGCTWAKNWLSLELGFPMTSCPQSHPGWTLTETTHNICSC